MVARQQRLARLTTLLNDLIATPEDPAALLVYKAIASDFMLLVDRQMAAESSSVEATAQLEVLSKQRLRINDELTRCRREELQAVDRQIVLEELEAVVRTSLQAMPADRAGDEVCRFAYALAWLPSSVCCCARTGRT